MVFDYAEHDLTGMIDAHKGSLEVPQVPARGRSGWGGTWRPHAACTMYHAWAACCCVHACGCMQTAPTASCGCPFPQVKCIMRQLLMALNYCHKNGVLHRDLKAANILITRDGWVASCPCCPWGQQQSMCCAASPGHKRHTLHAHMCQ